MASRSSRSQAEPRSISIFADGQLESSINDQWSGRTGGIGRFGIDAFQDGYVAHSSDTIWRTDSSLDTFTPIVEDGALGSVYPFADSVWYELDLRNSLRWPIEKSLFINQGEAGSSQNVELEIPNFSGFVAARMVGNKMVMVAGAIDPDSPFPGTEVWTSDGTIEGTTKVYENSDASITIGSASVEGDAVLEIWPREGGRIQGWLLSDGTPDGTRPADAYSIPSDRVTHTVNQFTYTLAPRAPYIGQWIATGPSGEIESPRPPDAISDLTT